MPNDERTATTMSAPRRLSLDGASADLWYALVDELVDPAPLAACQALLSNEERVQQARYVREADRKLHGISRALLRATLSRYADVPAAAWTFARNAYGKPEIAGPPGDTDLRFNLSHTAGLVVLLVARGRDVGVDAEAVDRRGRHLEHPEHFFSADEVRALRALPATAQRQRFFELWTLKEAYIKARGLGLALPLQEFSLRLATGRPPRIAFSAALPDDPGAWQFYSAQLGTRHQLAAAIARGSGPAVRFVVRNATVRFLDGTVP
jgi:4'-phosphopantetheinyl transferase